jgi:hypothetical protein
VNLLAPTALLFALLLPVIVAMYLLKLRRTEQQVSSVYLWQRMVRDLEANAPWQRLRRNLLMILQLLFVAALVLALARPFTWAEGGTGEAVVLIVDTSASMAATDVSPSRIEAAKTQARQWIDGLPAGTAVTIIDAGDGARVLFSGSQDVRQAHRAIDQLEAGAVEGDVESALELASALAAQQPDTEIAVLTDGRVTLPDRLAVKGRVRYVPIGLSGDNQAIAALSVRAMPDGTSLSAFCQVINYGEGTATRRLALYADGELVNAYDLEIPPRDQQAVVMEDLEMDVEVVEARLMGSDALGLDDRVWAVHERRERQPVVLVTEGNLFLETALVLLTGLEVGVIRPADWEEMAVETGGGEALAENALTIFDGYVPPEGLAPPGELFYVAPLQSTRFFSVTGEVEQPAAALVDPSDPLASFVTLDTISVMEAARLTPVPVLRTVIAGEVDGETVPLLSAGEVDGRRVAVLAFDLRRSDLPLQVSFPVLLANLTGWLVPQEGEIPTQVTRGAVVPVALPPSATEVRVTFPDGSLSQMEAGTEPLLLADTWQLGVYDLAWEGGGTSFAVNLFAPQESDLAPADALPVYGSEAEGGTAAQQARREWWRPIALVALALLVGEWFYYQRNALSRMASWIRKRL